MNQFNYPPSPQISDYTFLDPTPSFKKQVKQTIGAIILFITVYILLIIAAIFLLRFCFQAAAAILSSVRGLWPLLISIGLVCLGVMVFVFLFKFIFKVKKIDTSGSKEIKRKDHPKLFAFIDQLTTELKAPKPKKIFLIPEVNASVFYNSSFWSMFFPVRKNLNIGLGLVNCLNLSEFKGVLAHEFGHFSQRSMKLGSYVYTVNHVVYDLVYSYDRWDRTLQSWADAGGIFGLFAVLTYRIAELVRGLFRFFYKIINKQNMKLSREMEYNADLVAVSATGKEAMVSGLRRIVFGDSAYQIVLNYLNKVLKENKVPQNFYELHTAALNKLAKDNKLSLTNGLPVIKDEDIDKNQPQSRIIFKDQWASHPDQKDRETNINNVDIVADISEDSPWSLFNEPAELQREITKELYRDVTFTEKVEPLESAEFLDIVKKDDEKATMPDAYHGFYDNRLLLEFNWEEAYNNHKNKQVHFLFAAAGQGPGCSQRNF
ncbi:MAG: M48 family metallopeptidase [Bacteroidota bacterium]